MEGCTFLWKRYSVQVGKSVLLWGCCVKVESLAHSALKDVSLHPSTNPYFYLAVYRTEADYL